MRSVTNPARVSARTTRLPSIAGSLPAMLGDDRHATDFRGCVGGNDEAIVAAIVEDGANRFFGVGKRFLLGLALGHHLGERRHKHGEPAALLRFQDNRKAVARRHYVTPALHMSPVYQMGAISARPRIPGAGQRHRAPHVEFTSGFGTSRRPTAAHHHGSNWHTASNRCGAKVRTRSERSGHAESVGSGSI